MTAVKICGVTTATDAVMCAEAGAQALGINFWPGSVRCCGVEAARDIVAAVGGRVELVGVFVDAPVDEVRRTLAATGVVWAQLHGDEGPEAVAALLPHAYKALRVGDADVREEARRYPGEHLLLDALVRGQRGGTGHTFDWSLAEALVHERQLTLAGGLVPDNVAAAIRQVRPFRVDVASGVEAAPGRKDRAKVHAFMEAVRAVDADGSA
jgi:phosphoribosylanthranilate isomerase